MITNSLLNVYSVQLTLRIANAFYVIPGGQKLRLMVNLPCEGSLP